ncbi:HTH-type transcriptional regulator CysL [Vibrio aerogenes CECT 7868]|uniref:HTH-type transcriptional regulator CysL n=1 Tax=Vibrio aerogenes CECT 7868 TaxID=1216006 RepID=A0A1M5WN12_9VIBR|nr:LysR substrate-binding domain-containing protein [Vibrio aerogenes]SHH88413.1 HTH-type transcriptional regulator CysL [Vibrio aerogenes CECT 7868]
MYHISLRQLHIFTAITQHETLTQASEALFLSKAAVSMSLAELEKQLGHVLFDRVNHRLILNQEGKKLLPLADELLHRTNDIQQLFDNENNLTGQVRVGASDTIGNQVAPWLLSAFRQNFRHTSQTLFISNSALICQKLVDYELDIALIEGKTQHPELIAEQFSHDQMCIISSPDHPLVSHSNIQLADFENSNWVLREAGSGSREFFLRTVAPRLERWQETFQLNTTEALINSVAANLGFGCLSELAAQSALKDGRVVRLSVPLNMRRRYWLLVHKEKYQNPLLKHFIRFCFEWPVNDSV